MSEHVTESNEFSGPQWSYNDPASVRGSEIEHGLRGKIYEATPEDLAAAREHLLSRDVDDGLAEMSRAVAESPEGLHAYFQAVSRDKEVEAILVEEGLMPPTDTSL